MVLHKLAPSQNFRKLKIWTICTILIGHTVHVFSNCAKPQKCVLNRILHLPTTEGRDEDMLSLLWAKFRWSVSLVMLASVSWLTAPCSMEETVDTGLAGDGSGPTFKKNHTKLMHSVQSYIPQPLCNFFCFITPSLHVGTTFTYFNRI